MIMKQSNDPDFPTAKVALAGPQKDHWAKGIKRELNTLWTAGTWITVKSDMCTTITNVVHKIMEYIVEPEKFFNEMIALLLDIIFDTVMGIKIPFVDNEKFCSQTGGCQDALWQKNIISELTPNIRPKIKIHCDNLPAIKHSSSLSGDSMPDTSP